MISPDAGSNKKTSEVAGWLGHKGFVRADKLRDLTSGAIKEIAVYSDDLNGHNVVILDDICERGGTFIGLAKELKKKNCGKVILYITHGVFAGKDKDSVIESLYQGGIDEIYTTNSYRTDLPINSNFHVLDLEKGFYDKI
jgi:ribose-phosphate pyrophosphokinase